MSPNVAAPKPVMKETKKPSIHPPVSNMVKAAITSLMEKKGSSLPAIKKYIEANYKGIEMKRHSPFIRRFLKKAVSDGALVQTKGSYKMGAKIKPEKEAKKPATNKTKKPKRTTTPKKAVKNSTKNVAKKPAVNMSNIAKKPATKKSPKKVVKKSTAKTSSSRKITKKPVAKKFAKQ